MQAVPFIRIQPTANHSTANHSAVVRRHSSDYWTLFCIRQTTILHLQPRRLVLSSPPSSSPAALPFPCRQSERPWTRRHVFRGGMYPAVRVAPGDRYSVTAVRHSPEVPDRAPEPGHLLPKARQPAATTAARAAQNTGDDSDNPAVARSTPIKARIMRPSGP